MKFIIRLHPDIIVKSRRVRKRFTRLLEGNIRLVFERNHLSVEVNSAWDKILLLVAPLAQGKQAEIIELLQRILGIDQIFLVQESEFSDLDDVCEQIEQSWQDLLVSKSFVVRGRRRGEHTFSSVDAERYVGGYLNQRCDSKGVSLNNPDITIKFEINDNQLIQSHKRIKCLGGMPLPSQEDVLSLISGGYDSGVASYQMIRRGARTHFCFFNLGGTEHEIGVKQVSYYLWQRYSESHRVKFIAVDFVPVVADILEHIEDSHMGVVLKRMMMRAASKVADKLDIHALVTGESRGQVSSQILTNLSVIDKATDKLILRPLICMDKLAIINQATAIGTEDFAKVMPEYCEVISGKPTVKAQVDKIENGEKKLDFTIIDRMVGLAHVRDIRAAEEGELEPLLRDEVEVKHIPFFKLTNQFTQLSQHCEYFLYCKRGVMSRYQTLLLHEQGFNKVKVYRPFEK